MPTLKNFVAVDWRAGKDKIYFIFKDTNQYSRFDLADNQIETGYPREITENNWGQFSPYLKNVHFGFTTTNLDAHTSGDDILWLFYYVGETPMVCKYDQDNESSKIYQLKNSIWRALVPYIDRIVTGTWWQVIGHTYLFRFIMNDGSFLSFDYLKGDISHNAINSKTWPGLEQYKNQIITAVQYDRTFQDSYYYIFLNDNKYIRYNIQENKAETGPRSVDDESWPGLLRR